MSQCFQQKYQRGVLIVECHFCCHILWHSLYYKSSPRNVFLVIYMSIIVSSLICQQVMCSSQEWLTRSMVEVFCKTYKHCSRLWCICIDHFHIKKYIFLFLFVSRNHHSAVFPKVESPVFLNVSWCLLMDKGLLLFCLMCVIPMFFQQKYLVESEIKILYFSLNFSRTYKKI